MPTADIMALSTPAASNFNGLIQMRPYSTDAQHKAMGDRLEMQYGHISPNSVLVTSMGNHWQPGCWQKITDMIMATNKTGILCGLNELQDRCLNWGDALGTMRNEGLMMASNEGWEWICYIDNDVLPEPDTLIRLLQRQQSVIVPYIVEPGSGKKLHGPAHEPGTGLYPLRWAVLSMLLMRTNVLHAVGPNFWRDAIGADEGVHFMMLWHYGLQLVLDSDVIVQTTQGPTYPLGTNRLEWTEREKYWQGRRQALNTAPDRRRLDGGTQGVINGAYMPFLQPQNGHQPQAAIPVQDWGESTW